MIALPKDRPLVDGENEYITVTRTAPVFKGRQHLHPDWWVAEGRLDGALMRLIVLHIDRCMFVEAGYVASEIFRHVETAVNVEVLTMLDADNRWRPAKVVSRDESATVHTDAERQQAWKADLVKYGNSYQRISATELQFSTSGEWTTWTRNDQGQYIRLTATTRDLYEGKAVS
jgi:hypothetical protein